MHAETVLAKAIELRERAARLRGHAAQLRRDARAARHRYPHMRWLRLAHGASDAPPRSQATGRRCPVCQSDRTERAGKILADESTMEVLYRCIACAETFWLLRSRP